MHLLLECSLYVLLYVTVGSTAIYFALLLSGLADPDPSPWLPGRRQSASPGGEEAATSAAWQGGV